MMIDWWKIPCCWIHETRSWPEKKRRDVRWWEECYDWCKFFLLSSLSSSLFLSLFPFPFLFSLFPLFSSLLSLLLMIDIQHTRKNPTNKMNEINKIVKEIVANLKNINLDFGISVESILYAFNILHIIIVFLIQNRHRCKLHSVQAQTLDLQRFPFFPSPLFLLCLISIIGEQVMPENGGWNTKKLFCTPTGQIKWGVIYHNKLEPVLLKISIFKKQKRIDFWLLIRFHFKVHGFG